MFPKPTGGKKGRYRGIPADVKRRVYERAGGTCEGPVVRIGEMDRYDAERTGKCGNVGNQLAHINHRKMGGSRVLDTDDNLLLLCIECHDRFDGRIE